MKEDEWVKAAMLDDCLIVELLMQLNQSKAHVSSAVRKLAALAPLEWGVRQPRTKQVLRCNVMQAKKEGESSARASPTTPLSWSGGTYISGGGASDGCDESSKPVKRSSGGRSKATHTSEVATVRRSRKKKTFSELKDEESLLLKERTHLKKELAALRITLEEQRTRNESLKRMKLDLQIQSANKPSTPKKETCEEPQQAEAVSVDHTPKVSPTTVPDTELQAAVLPSPPSDSHEVENKDAVGRESPFVLPDLNLPLDDNPGSEALYGMS